MWTVLEFFATVNIEKFPNFGLLLPIKSNWWIESSTKEVIYLPATRVTVAGLVCCEALLVHFKIDIDIQSQGKSHSLVQCLF